MQPRTVAVSDHRIPAAANAIGIGQEETMRQVISYLASAALLLGTMPTPVRGQAPAPASTAAPAPAASVDEVQKFSTEQLDALLAPIALYPDALLTQMLMAATYPVDIVSASRWLAQGNNKDLNGQALENALKTQPWDPSVKSLVPFPQVLDMMNQQLEWTQQLGFAMSVQQQEVFDSVQRLRLQAQRAGNLQSTAQQVVRVEPPPPDVVVVPGAPQQIIVIEPAQPDVVFVPRYNPTTVFGTWPYPATPPVFYPSMGYGSALAAGLMFGAGVAITAGLWGWARPNWGCCWGGNNRNNTNINVNVNRWNNINVNNNRPWHGGSNGQWRPNNPNFRPGGPNNRPGGPVGRPNRPGGLPPNAIGRPGVSVPGNTVRPPPGMGPGNNRPGIGGPNQGRPGGGQAGQRPGGGEGRPGAGVQRPGGGEGRPGAGVQRPGGGEGRPGAGAQRPGGGEGRPGAGVQRPGGDGQAGIGQQRPGGGGQQIGGQRPGRGANARPARDPSAFRGMNEGRNAQQFGNRGAQSRQMSAPSNRGGGGGGGRGGGGRGGGGRGR